MRSVALLMVLSGIVRADILPGKADCGAPAVCRACSFIPPDDGGARVEVPAGCFAGAEDAGLEVFPCIQVDGGSSTYFYCPPDTGEQPKQGCSSIMLGAPLALLAVFGAWRTRKRA